MKRYHALGILVAATVIFVASCSMAIGAELKANLIDCKASVTQVMIATGVPPTVAVASELFAGCRQGGWFVDAGFDEETALDQANGVAKAAVTADNGKTPYMAEIQQAKAAATIMGYYQARALK